MAKLTTLGKSTVQSKFDPISQKIDEIKYYSNKLFSK